MNDSARAAYLAARDEAEKAWYHALAKADKDYARAIAQADARVKAADAADAWPLRKITTKRKSHNAKN